LESVEYIRSLANGFGLLDGLGWKVDLEKEE
jgi:hypothetical protein